MAMNKKEQRAADKAAKAKRLPTATIKTREDEHGYPGQDENGNAPKPEPAPTTTKKARPVLLDGAGNPLPMPPKAKKARKPKPTKMCACGCGGQTKGGRFVSGHDSYLKSWCLRVERGAVKLEDIPHEGVRAAVVAHMAPKPQA